MNLLFQREMQKHDSLRATLDDEFLRELSTNFTNINDDRVVVGLTCMLRVKILVITSTPTGASSRLYRPPKAKNKEIMETLALGHIEDHHFVPLIRKNQGKFRMLI